MLARDTFTISASGTFDIMGGAADCTTGKSATITVEDVNAQFEVADLPLNGEAYVPGEMIDYQITLEILADVSGVMFELILPVPVHDVEDLYWYMAIKLYPEARTPKAWCPPSPPTTRAMHCLDYGDVSMPTSGTSSFISARVSVEVSDVLLHLGWPFRHCRICTSNSEQTTQPDFARRRCGLPESKRHGAYQPTTSSYLRESRTPWEVYGIDGRSALPHRLEEPRVSGRLQRDCV